MRGDLERLYDVPFIFVVNEMVSLGSGVRNLKGYILISVAQDKGRAIPSFTSRFLSEKGKTDEDEKEFVKAAAASLYSGI